MASDWGHAGQFGADGGEGGHLDPHGQVMGRTAGPFEVLSKHPSCAVSLGQTPWVVGLPKGAYKPRLFIKERKRAS